MRQSPTDWIGIAYLTAAVLIWSTAEIVTRLVVDQIGPIQLAWVRFTVGALMLLALLPGELRRRGVKIDRLIMRDAALLAIPGIVLNAICYQYGLKYAGAAVFATVFGASPIAVYLLSRLILGEPLTRARGLGVLFGFLGILVLAASKPSAHFSLLGLLLAIACVVSFSLFTVYLKRVGAGYTGVPFTAVCFTFGALYLMPLTLLDGDTNTLAHARTLFIPVLYLSIATTGLAYILYFKGLERIDATQASSIILLKPPVAAILAWAILGEAITTNLLFSMLLILGGLYLVIWASRRHARLVEAP